ncbi:hypothetical protein C8J56DRAFT_794873 [Mycena floridula]|nr:hypothetical protein C8J56DRAFT_794873 [Mycena floridula]
MGRGFVLSTLALRALWLFSLLFPVQAHVSPWHPSMWCFNGAKLDNDQDTNTMVVPLFGMEFKDWWMHHFQNCDQFPPADGQFLELPAGENVTLELAVNRAFTTYSYDGTRTSAFLDGSTMSEDRTHLLVHTQNFSMTAGTALAISYQSNLADVTPENLVVFSTKSDGPWHRLNAYDVPAALPECPEGGCICVWGWIPNHCGEPNFYQVPMRCKVTGATGTKPVAPGQPPVFCENDTSKCVKGAKQMTYYEALSGNNIELIGSQADGLDKSPGYNHKLGYVAGAQNDIFVS